MILAVIFLVIGATIASAITHLINAHTLRLAKVDWKAAIQIAEQEAHQLGYYRGYAAMGRRKLEKEQAKNLYLSNN